MAFDPGGKDWKWDRLWASRANRSIKEALGRHLIGVASQLEDWHHNADFQTIFTLNKATIAARIRREKWFHRRHEFTIRTYRPSGAPTEMDKLLQGWGDYFFYGILTAENDLVYYRLARLDIFRRTFSDYWNKHHKSMGLEKTNEDGTKFRVFEWADFPEDFSIAHEMQKEVNVAKRQTESVARTIPRVSGYTPKIKFPA